MNPSQAPLHPFRRYPAQHPLAGLALRAVGTLPSGRVVWPIMGGSPDGEGDGGDAAAAAAAEAAKTAASETEKAAADAAAKTASDKVTADGKVEDLPEWAQKIIKDTRGEAAENRTKASAAEKKLTEQLDGIAKALGLKDDKATDPAELARQLEQQRDAAKQSATELAVYKTASKHQGDPDALLDSRGFLAKLTDLDPTAKNFADKVETAIREAIAENPKLQATRAATSSSADHAGGSGNGGGKPTSLEEAIAGRMNT